MKKRTAATTFAVIAALAIGPSTAAIADDGSTPTNDESSYSYTAPLDIVAYDAEVAEAHGYRIETDENGEQYSVPVTPEAIAEQERDEAAAESMVQARGTVYGNCGTSSLTGFKSRNDTVTFSTSFAISGSVAEYDWRVNVYGFISNNYWSTSGFGPLAGGTKSWTGAIPGVVGPGTARVPANSAQAAVIKTNGAVCWSGGPSFGFD
ncbi:hypothetical protein BKA24_002846 [Microbacterium marinum]|uniref:Secreted protein n=1 Tax=Microbacterium marinum TaxID=421115 RepID=A0A7W7FJI8_9MICO|nr:hypothetical protein [Microbacterium marinum]MBB4668137.1 hypothetical protein [Microbacterium marinum]